MNQTVAIISTCKNRQEMLSVSLASWLANRSVSEIVITDWSSNFSLQYLAKIDSRITIVRVENQGYFHKTRALNLALNHVTSQVILQMDVDYILNPYYNLIRDLEVSVDEFVVGDGWTGAIDQGPSWDFFAPTNGFLCVHKEALDKVGGYNEELKGWGYEDADIQNRLWSIGLKRKILFLTKKQYLYHNPHPKSKRVENYQNKNMSKSHRNNELIGEKWRDDLDDCGYYR